MPPNFGTVTAPPLCASGDLAAGNTNVAMVGVNLNQASTPPNSPAMSVVPTLDGINVSVTNNGTSLLRLQIQGPNGATDANQRWCAPIFGSGGFIPWNAFNTKCWDGTGTAYKKEPIVAAMILVPGGTAAVRFNFCLNNLAAANDPSGPGGGGCSLTGGSGEGTGTITGQFDWRGVTRGGRNYVVQNNVWGGTGSQSLSYSGVSFTVTQQTGNNSHDRRAGIVSVGLHRVEQRAQHERQQSAEASGLADHACRPAGAGADFRRGPSTPRTTFGSAPAPAAIPAIPRAAT